MDGGFTKIVFWNKWKLIHTVRGIIRTEFGKGCEIQGPHLLASSPLDEWGWEGLPAPSGWACTFLSSFAITQFGPRASLLGVQT